MEKDEGPSKRINLDLQAKSMARLESLKKKTEAQTYAEVFRNALRLYEALIDITENDGEFQLRYPGRPWTPFQLWQV